MPQPVLLWRDGRASALVMHACAGRSLSDWILDRGLDGAIVGCVLGPVLDLVKRLHGAGLVHRDLYWNHLLVLDPADRATSPALIDVERVLRPIVRRQRWLEKDLAGLLGSWPLERIPAVLALRFFRGWLGGALVLDWKRSARAIIWRARRIRSQDRKSVV